MYWCFGGSVTGSLRFNLCLFAHQARGGTHGGGGTTVTEGNTRVSRCYHWPLRRTPLWAAKSLDWSLHLVAPNPTHHVSHLDWRLLGQTRGRGGWAQPQSREPIRRRRTELGKKKKFKHTGAAWRRSLRDTHSFSVSRRNPHVSPPRLTMWPRQWRVYLEFGGEIRSRHREVQELAVLYTAAFWPHTLWTPGGSRHSQLWNTVREVSFLFSQLFYPTKTRASRQLRYYCTRCVHCGLWSAEVWVGFCKDLRLSPHWSSLSLKRLASERSALVRVGGSAGFQDCSGKDCLKSKDFSCWGLDAREGDGEFPVLFLGVGKGEWQQSFSMFTWNVTKTTFMSVTASLEELLYFWMDLFFCKKKRKKKGKRFVKVVASFSRKTVQTWRPSNKQIRLKSLSLKKKKKVQPLM